MFRDICGLENLEIDWSPASWTKGTCVIQVLPAEAELGGLDWSPKPLSSTCGRAAYKQTWNLHPPQALVNWKSFSL